jgi:hypothetical protein
MARPTKLTPEAQERIVKALKGGNYRKVAVRWAGISYRVFAEWMARGKESPKSAFGSFRRAVIEAEEEAEIGAVALVMVAARSDPKHAEWWLSHRHPERWSEKQRVKIERDKRDIGPVVDMKKITTLQLISDMRFVLATDLARIRRDVEAGSPVADTDRSRMTECVKQLASLSAQEAELLEKDPMAKLSEEDLHELLKRAEAEAKSAGTH